MEIFLPYINSSFNACSLPCCRNCTSPHTGINCKYFENAALDCSLFSANGSFDRGASSYSTDRVNCNATMNMHQLHVTIQDLTFATKLSFVIAYSIVLVIGVPGNFVVCYILGRKRKVSVVDAFLLAIGATGLLSTLIGPTHQIILFTSKKDISPKRGSQIAAFLFDSLSMFEAWLLVEVAADRLWAIQRPLQWRAVTVKPRIYLFILTFTAIVSITLPAVVSTHLGWSTDTKLSYSYMLTFIGFALPLVSTAVFYAFAFKALRRNQIISDSKGNYEATREHKAVRLFVTVVAFFALSTLPHLVIDIYFHFNKTKSSSMLVHEAAVVFHTLNPCINPFIYSKMHHDIRQFSRKLWNKMKKAEESSTGCFWWR